MDQILLISVIKLNASATEKLNASASEKLNASATENQWSFNC